MRWKGRLKTFGAVLASLLVASAPAGAGLVGGTGYGVNEPTMDTRTGKSYAGGMDVVYAQIATGTAAAKTRSFLKCEDGDWSGNWGVQVAMYDYRGKFVGTLGSAVNPYGSGMYSVFAQGLKVDPTPDGGGNRAVWFSMTGSGADEGDWYTVTVNPDFNTVVSGPTAQFSQAGNWEVEWNPVTGQGFFAGKATDAWVEPHAIYIWTGTNLQKVVDVGGYSCGFAFDPDGNLYTGTYTDSGPASQQYVRMYTAAQVAAAVSSGTPLTPAAAANTIAIPSPNGVYLGANDLEADVDGNIYLTANGAWDDTYQSDVGYVFRIDAWNPSSPPTTMTRIAAGTMDPSNPDWQKAMAFDGSSNLAEGGHYDPTNPSQMGNRLYVDQDFWWGSGGPDVVSGLSTSTDTDADGVPDALDNAHLTANAAQQDADQDMYGNIADADFNNDGLVGTTDMAILKANWLGSNPVVDMDGNGTVGTSDFTRFKSRWLASAPFF